jgi:hypothetical protein
MWRHLKPAVTVVVDFSRLPDHLPQHRGMYPDAIWTTWKGVGFPFDNPHTLPALKSCDVILSVETFYDPRIHTLPIPSVLYINPELFRGYGAPTYWTPTSWLHDRLPQGTRIVPYPVALDHPYRRGEGMMHVAGRNASYDRNGTIPAAAACKKLGGMLKVVAQVDMPKIQGAEYVPQTDDYWELYGYGGVLVMPRRYGGMCLPVQEALAAGLVVVMTDTEPNRDWPVRLVPGRVSTVRTVAGSIPCCDVDEAALTDTLRRVDEWRDDLEAARLEWLNTHSWEALLPVWREALEDAAG